MLSPLTTWMVKNRCAVEGRHQSADGGFSSLNSSQKLKSPSCAGIPCTRPLLSIVSPGGAELSSKRYWYGNAGPQPPAPLKLQLYGLPVCPKGGVKLSSVNLSANAAGTTTSASRHTPITTRMKRISLPFFLLCRSFWTPVDRRMVAGIADGASRENHPTWASGRS